MVNAFEMPNDTIPDTDEMRDLVVVRLLLGVHRIMSRPFVIVSMVQVDKLDGTTGSVRQ